MRKIPENESNKNPIGQTHQYFQGSLKNIEPQCGTCDGKKIILTLMTQGNDENFSFKKGEMFGENARALRKKDAEYDAESADGENVV